MIHDLASPWTSSNPAVLQLSADTGAPHGTAPASMRLRVLPGAVGAFAEFAPASAADLDGFEELRFWVRADRVADGTTNAPFFLELSYVDTGDGAGEEHRWLVPVNRAGVWEQRRIGIEGDRRTAVQRYRFTVVRDLSFTCHLAELLAVTDELVRDVEDALVTRIDGIALPGVTEVPLAQTANPGNVEIVLPPTPGFHVGNRIRLVGGSAGTEIHAVTGVTTGAGPPSTVLHLAASDAVVGTLPAGTATASVVAPVIVADPPVLPAAAVPCVLVTPLDSREDLARSHEFTQRDSFRPRGAVLTCSVRRAPRAFNLDYRLSVLAQRREQQTFLQQVLLARCSTGRPLRVNGAAAPVAVLPPPAPEDRLLGTPASIDVRIGTRMETAPRREQTAIRTAEVAAGPIGAPSDQEGIVLEL